MPEQPFSEFVSGDFRPEAGVSDVQFRVANALEYIAYKMGAVEGHLGTIAAALGDADLQTEASVRRSLAGVATEVSRLRNRFVKNPGNS